MVFQENLKQWIKDTKSLKETTKLLYNIVWYQCSKLMKNRLLEVREFENIETAGDVTRLLKEVRGVSHQMEKNTSIYDTIDKAKIKYYKYRHGDHESNAKHLKNFKDIVEVIEHPGGNIFADTGLLKYESYKDIKEGNMGVTTE